MKKIAIISTIFLGMSVASCDSYLDINQDPNSPVQEVMTTSIMMPAAEMGLAATYGNLLRIPGGYFSQHYSHMFGTSNYVDYSQFTMSPVRSNSAYAQLNTVVLKNVQTILGLAEKNEEWGTYLAATTLRCFALQALVDCYGSVVYTEALDYLNNSSPHYDEGSVVYEGLLKELDEALAKADADDIVATNFLYKGQSAANWIKFANALKLKILSRASKVASFNADAQIAAIISEGNLPTADVAYTSCWSNETGQMNPYYSEEFSSSFGSTQINVTANLALVGTMQLKDENGDIVYQDPRLAAFFAKNNSGEFTGGVSGTNFSTTDQYKSGYWCRPAMAYNTPVCLISLAEIEFFISEFYARKNDAAQAAAHYAAAVEASFASAGVGGAAENISRYPYDQANYKQVLGLAKWIALSGVNNFESWCELRRLRYPAFGNVTGEQIYNVNTDDFKPELYVPGTLYTPIQVDGNIGKNHLIERWPFASDASSSNGNAPKFENSDYLKPLFWAE